MRMLPMTSDNAPPIRYAEYIASRAWARRRRKAIRSQGARCARCLATESLHVHHLTELPEDLLVVCEGCHDVIHAAHRLHPDRLLADVTREVVGARLVRRDRRKTPDFVPRHLRDPEKSGWSRSSWKP